MHFFQKLAARVATVDSLLCVGLDPAYAADAQSARDYCTRVIDASHPYAAAFKPNSAFFEQFGAPGLTALAEVIAHIPAGIPVILDAKRGDIGNTAAAYARAAFQVLKADAVTVSPYLGRESVMPFLESSDSAVFVLCRTSNPDSDAVQALPLLTGELLYSEIARQVVGWDHERIGLVVGATDPAAVRAIRQVAVQAWLLLPGIGAQGGDLETVVANGLRADRSGVLVNVSRAIADSADSDAPGEDPGSVARAFRDRINAVRREHNPVTPVAESLVYRVAEALSKADCVRFGSFTLKSGGISPIYLDLRRLVGYPVQMAVIANAINRKAEGLHYDHYAAIPYAALPIVTVAALQKGLSLVYPRRENKEYGTKAQVEGVFVPGQTALLIDDIATTGGSKFDAVEKLASVGLKVTDVLVVIDRQGGGAQALRARGLGFHTVTTLPELMDIWEQQGTLSQNQRDAVEDYLGANRA